MANSSRSPQRVAVAGLGAIGIKIVEVLDKGIDGLVLAAVSAQNPAKHQQFLARLNRPPSVLPIDGLSDVADIVIECAPSKLVRAIVAPFGSRGKTSTVRTARPLLENED